MTLLQSHLDTINKVWLSMGYGGYIAVPRDALTLELCQRGYLDVKPGLTPAGDLLVQPSFRGLITSLYEAQNRIREAETYISDILNRERAEAPELADCLNFLRRG